MSLTLSLEIVTPDKVVLRCDAAAVTAPGVAGEFTALPLHVPFLSALRIGSLHYRGATQNGTVFVSGGFADVTHEKVLILAEAAELPEEIDLDRARTIGDIAKVLVDTARVEVDFVKHTGSNGSGFIPEAEPGPGVHRLAHTPGPATKKLMG